MVKITKSTQSNLLEKFIPTTDNWHPNFEGDTVKMFLGIFESTRDFIRIAVWGKDDFGLEMDFHGTPEENKLKFAEWEKTIYDKVPTPCTKKYFRDLGFRDA